MIPTLQRSSDAPLLSREHALELAARNLARSRQKKSYKRSKVAVPAFRGSVTAGNGASAAASTRCGRDGNKGTRCPPPCAPEESPEPAPHVPLLSKAQINAAARIAEAEAFVSGAATGMRPGVVPMKRDKTSWVWQFAQEVEAADGTPLGRCTVADCGHECAITNGSTSGLISHLKAAHGVAHVACVDANVGRLDAVREWDVNRALCCMVALGHLPVSFCESDAFRFFMGIALPQWDPLTADTLLRNHVLPLADAVVDAESSSMDPSQFFSVGLDAWQSGEAPGSSNKREFVGVVVTCLDKNFNLVQARTGMERVRGSLDHKETHAAVKRVLKRLGIPSSRVVAYSSDNQTVETAAIALEEHAYHVRCLCHTIHLAITDAESSKTRNVEVCLLSSLICDIACALISYKLPLLACLIST